MQAIDASENVDFNLHTHVECNSPLLPDPKTIVISTHALTWSATRFGSRSRMVSWYFNSRTHVECDQKVCLPSCPERHFNSRTHVECDIMQYLYNLDTSDFNSRTHVECDDWLQDGEVPFEISTHALTWSATIFIVSKSSNECISTHALTWSATTGWYVCPWCEFISTHALTWSATFPITRFWMDLQISTHALTWSATVEEMNSTKNK